MCYDKCVELVLERINFGSSFFLECVYLFML